MFICVYFLYSSIGMPYHWQPCACALSSTNFNPWRRQISAIRSVIAHRPYRCTMHIAFVRSVMAASMSVSSISSVRGFGSTHTGTNPFSVIPRWVAIYVLAGNITSSPGCITPNSMYARHIHISASNPLAHPMQYLVPIYSA